MTISNATRLNFENTSVSTISTALFLKGFRNRVIKGAKPLNSNATRIIAPAFTLRYIPAREDLDVMGEYAKDSHVQRRAFEECPKGHVLVIDAMGDTRAASAGDIMLSRLKERGCCGAITDGGFRDNADICKLEFPVFQSEPAVPSSPIHLHPAELNVPIGCGGVAVYPGDIVVSDSDGAIVVPQHLADEIAAQAAEMSEYEIFVTEKISQGRSIFGLFPATNDSRREYDNWKRSR